MEATDIISAIIITISIITVMFACWNLRQSSIRHREFMREFSERRSNIERLLEARRRLETEQLTHFTNYPKALAYLKEQEEKKIELEKRRKELEEKEKIKAEEKKLMYQHSSSRVSKAARLLDEIEGTKKRRKK